MQRARACFSGYLMLCASWGQGASRVITQVPAHTLKVSPKGCLDITYPPSKIINLEGNILWKSNHKVLYFRAVI